MSGKLISGVVIASIAVVALIFIGVVLLIRDDAPNDADVENGEAIALGESTYQTLCAGCHSIDGSDVIGPTFMGLYGSEVTMDDGSTVVVDDDHLSQAITDPRATTREGFPDVMPSFSDLDEDEVEGLIAFIRAQG